MVELFDIICATIISSLINIAVFEITSNDLPEACYFLYFLVLTLCLGFTRFVYRLLRIYKLHIHPKSRKELQRVMIIGAGLAGEKTYREIIYNPIIFKQVVCFIDDDKSKQGRRIHDVTVYGGREKIIEAAKEFGVEEMLLAMPSGNRKEVADILNICKETGCQIKKLPGIYQMINGDIHISDFKDVEIQDLLGREPINVNIEDIIRYVTGKVVMVTGGGGSIGSELCRQIAASGPKQLIIVDIYENNAYDIQLELKHKYPNLNLETIIASVRNSKKMDKLFEKYQPDIVYHAAAHKHVPLMEDSPNEAVKNNVSWVLLKEFVR